MKELTPAYILHTRLYRETSLLIDFFTEQYGRLSVVARGARGKNRKTALQPFYELLIDVGGSSELKTLKHYEPKGSAIFLNGEKMFFGMYINELLTRVLGRYDPMASLYNSYSLLLNDLSRGDGETSLRRFELQLLSELGYGVVFDYELLSGDQVVSEKLYCYDPENGFAISTAQDRTGNVYSGEDMLAIGNGDFTRPSTKSAAKQIVRQALAPLLGGKPLNSRELFRSMRRTGDD